MADDEAQSQDGELSATDEESSEQPSEAQPGAVERASSLGRAAQRTAQLAGALKGGVASIASTVFGPGKWIDGGLAVSAAVLFAIAGILLTVGLTARLLTKLGGSQPAAKAMELGEEQTKRDLQLIACYQDRPPQQWGDPGKTQLSAECIKVVQQEVERQRNVLERAEQELQGSGTNEADKQKVRDLIAKIRVELDGIDQANGAFKESKEHYESLKKLLDDPAAKLLDGLVFSCESEDVIGEQSASNAKLYRLKGGGSSPIRYYYQTNEREGRDYVSPEMACYLVELTKRARLELNLSVEIGDASTPTGASAWGPHSQHGFGTNVDIWAPSVMAADLQGSAWDPDLAVRFAKMIIDLGAKELFITQDYYPNAIREYSIDVGGHADHWHICIENC